MTHDTHDPVLDLVRGHLDDTLADDGARAGREQALAEIQRHPAVLLDTALQLAELCAALADAAGDRLGRSPAELVETYRGLLRMVANDRPTLRMVDAS